MNQALSIASPTLGYIGLGQHAAHFVVPHYHKVPVEKLLYLYTDRLRHFAGAWVQLLTGEVVPIVRELSPCYARRDSSQGLTSMMANGPTFILGSVSAAGFGNAPSMQQREELWRATWKRFKKPMASGTLFDPLPLPPCALERLHFDTDSGWGCRVSYNGIAELVDLRGAAIGHVVAPSGFLALMERDWLGEL
ncbi:hypothetical protein EON83_29325 [bacterium]|nr:MAG: hypothetical protein EON83_29325 [bacterium]